MTADELLVARIERDLGAKDLLIHKLSAQVEIQAEQLQQAKARIAELETSNGKLATSESA